MGKSHNQKTITHMDDRVIALAEQLIQMPPGLVRDGMIVQLSTAIQAAIDEWFRLMTGPA